MTSAARLLFVIKVVFFTLNPVFKSIFPSEYYSSDPPRGADGSAAKIFVAFHIMDIDEISESKMGFRLHLFVIDMWKDDRLNLDAVLDNSSVRIVPEEIYSRIWKPDIIFVNSKSGYLFRQSVTNKFVKILDDGHLYRTTRYLFQVDCLMKLQKYPMDKQNCFLKVGLLSTPSTDATLHWMDDPISPHRNVSLRLVETNAPLQFDIAQPKPHKTTEQWIFTECDYLYANFTFTRRITASLLNTYIPTGIVVIMSWGSFWLDVNATPARTSIGVTSVLTTVTQIVQSRNSTPSVDYLKAVDVWLFICLLMVFLANLEYPIAYNVEKFYTLNRYSQPDKYKDPKGRRMTVAQTLFRYTNIIDKVSRIMFPSAFFVFIIIYWATYLSMGE
ncbi:gamma-aminobutyric acid receptor subunit rho-1 [Galendromus occidentalis]|uniref:Gamma-aminobutyric acid receptor subunit rho-1 n=1 Tax=Galendromus occidentalis TaxID=34638 RepID=A0AAJ7SIS2_9ACAR|nr:gamma-aminobutyric acid receptor subunit rho-1 [Galendromus occidentalis]